MKTISPSRLFLAALLATTLALPSALRAATDAYGVPAGFVRHEIPATSTKFISTPFVPFSGTLDALLAGQLTGADSADTADLIRKWGPATQDFVDAIKAAGTGDPSKDGKWFAADGTPTTLTLGPGEGFVVVSRQAFDQQLFLTGKVVLAGTWPIYLSPGLTLFAFPFTSWQALNEAGLLADGADSPERADFLGTITPATEHWRRTAQGDAAPGPWLDKASGNFSTLELKSGHAYWYRRLLGTGLVWPAVRPYENPFDVGSGAPAIAGMVLDADGLAMTLQLSCTGGDGEVLEVFYKDLTENDDLNPGSGWDVAAADLTTDGQTTIAWSDRGGVSPAKPNFFRPAITVPYLRLYLVSRQDRDEDMDGLSTGCEKFVYNTNPEIADTDGDGTLDGAEVAAGTDPNSPTVAPRRHPTPLGDAPSAALLVYEPFDYDASVGAPEPPTGLAGKNGGIGFSGAWALSSLDAGVEITGLTYAKNDIMLQVAGRSGYTQLGTPSWQFDELIRYIDMSEISSDLKAPDGKLGKVGTTLWFSTLINLADIADQKTTPPANLGWWAGIKPTSQPGWFGRNFNASTWGIEYPAQNSSVGLTYGETVFLVQKVEYTTNGAVTTLWVNPTPALDDSTAAPTESAAIAEYTETAYTFNYLVYSSSCEANIDEFRLGTTYHDVAPGQAATLTMAVSPSGSGTTDPAIGAHTVPVGAAQEITATAASGWRFVNWSATTGATLADVNAITTTVTLTANATVTANFVQDADPLLIAYEGFIYPADGTSPATGLAGRNGGTGFADAWSSRILDAGVDGHGLFYSKNDVALQVAGKSAYNQIGRPNSRFDELSRHLDLSQVPAGLKAPDGKLGKVGTTLWVSMLVNLADNPTQQAPPKGNIGWWAGMKLNPAAGWFGRNANASTWGLEWPRKDSTVDLTYGETVFLVQKVEYTAVGAVTTFWVNPTPAIDEEVLVPEESAAISNWTETAYFYNPDTKNWETPLYTFNHITYASSCQGNLDEFRVGTTYHDVAPATVAPKEDADGDGIANADEIDEYGTNPFDPDTDGDGINDYDELFVHETDPLSPDTDGDLLSDYDEINTYGTDPLDPDTDSDGMGDGFEVLVTFTDPLVADTLSTIQTVDGRDYTATGGTWQRDGDRIHCLSLNGWIEYDLTIPDDGIFLVEVEGTQYNEFSTADRFTLDLSLDGVAVGRQTLVAPYGTLGKTVQVLPYLVAGSHTLRLAWRNHDLSSSLEIVAVRLRACDGDWQEDRLNSMKGVTLPTTTLTSPVCLEGTNSSYLEDTSISGYYTPTGETPVPPVCRYAPNRRWFADVSVNPDAPSTITVSFQGGAVTTQGICTWLATDITSVKPPTIRAGDALKLVVENGDANQPVTITVENEEYETTIGEPVVHQFDTAGTFTVDASYTSGGLPVSAELDVTVVTASFNDAGDARPPACIAGFMRDWANTGLSDESVVETETFLQVVESSLSPVGRNLRLFPDRQGRAYFIARLGVDGPILDQAHADIITIASSNPFRSYQILQYFPDGSWLGECALYLGEIPAGLEIRIDLYTAGVTFDDATTSRVFTAADFDENGVLKYRLLVAPGTGAICHEIHYFQDGVEIAL